MRVQSTIKEGYAYKKENIPCFICVKMVNYTMMSEFTRINNRLKRKIICVTSKL